MEKNNQAGKGDKRRPGDDKVFRNNYDNINWQKPLIGWCDCCRKEKEVTVIYNRFMAGICICKQCKET